MPGYARRTDANQSEIVRAYEQVGATVRTLQLEAGGIPDILVGLQGVNYLVEIKTDTGELTPAQVKFFVEWKGQKAIVRDTSEALRVIGVEAGPLRAILPSSTQIDRYAANVAQRSVVWSMDSWRQGRRR